MDHTVKHPQNSLLKRCWLGIGIFGLAFLLLLQSIPFFAIQWAKHEFTQQGTGYQLQIQDWHWSPWAGELDIIQLELQHPTNPTHNQQYHLQQSQKSGFSSLRIRFNPWDLLKGELHLDYVSFSGLQFSVHLQNTMAAQSLTKSVCFLGFTIALPESTDKPTHDNLASQPNESTPWPIHVKRISFSNSTLSWLQDGSTQQPSSNGRVHITQFQLGPFNNQATLPIEVNGQLSLNEFSLSDQSNNEQSIALKQPLDIHIQGQLFNFNTQPTWQGDLSLANVSLQLPQKNHVLLTYLQLTQLHVTTDMQGTPNVAWQALRLENLKIAREQHPLVSLGAYQINDVKWQPTSIHSGAMQYENLHLNVQRLANGHLQGFEHLSEEKINAVPVAESIVSESSHTPQPSQIISINITALKQLHSHSSITISDKSVLPAFSGNLTISHLNIAPIYILQQGDGELIPIHISAQLSLDEYNQFKINAALALKTQSDGTLYPQGKITFSIQQLDMVAFNGYLAKAIGYHLEKGMLQLEGEVEIINADLKGEVKILLKNSRFIPENEKIIASLSKKISMPVDMALDLLRDENGNVKLNIPISGNLNNPNFGIGNLSAQLSQLVLKNAALHYLKLSLQPYGLFLSLASYAGSELMAVRLDALKYSPKEYELNDQHILKLQKIASIMKEKSALELQACPFVNEEEATEPAEDWQDLAVKRGAHIKAWLAKKTDQEESSLAPRVTLCKPQISSQSEVVLGFN